ncbi:hypothetical protein [Arthrobacter flavus]|uniref:SMODS and SLOG-associating 2TM effector domain-containing protein n=1 Tax=Arthrobacter flavus TaxID=95172 RepID=A0ABW4Q202_9MICC
MALGMRLLSRLSDKGTPAQTDADKQRANNLLMYEALLLREVEKDSLLWQAPSLALTAQAFLLTIALGQNVEPAAVLISASLGLIIALLSMQLMARHRLLTHLDRTLMHYLEDQLGIHHLSNRAYFYQNGLLDKKSAEPRHEDGEYRIPIWLNGHEAPKRVNWFSAQKSFYIWFWGLASFGLVNLGIIISEGLQLFA